MAALARYGRTVVRSFTKQKSILASVTPRASVTTWNKDWKPGPYPRTPEERAAAAKKYGLRPEDYEPYPDDGFGYGDYPKLPLVSTESKDPYAEYDIPSLKRQYGEPMHVNADILREDCWNPNANFKTSFPMMWAWLGCVAGGIILSYIVLDEYPMRPNVMPKQFPTADKTYYTFETKE